MKRLLLALLLALLFAAPCLAHGGLYRPPYGGPGDTVPKGPPGPGGPGAGGGPTSPRPSQPTPPAPVSPVTPRSPFPLLPTTGGKDELPGPSSWQLWWSYNHDALLDLRTRLHALAASSGENPIAAERRRLQMLLAPALVRMLESGGKESVLRQALIALARLAKVEELDVPLERLAQIYSTRNSPNLQEAALLALGVGGNLAAIECLRHVLMDDESGREQLLQEGTIPIRMRVFAAYALGLLGRRAPLEATRRQCVHALLFALGQEAAIEREVRVACTLALGLVPIEPCATSEQALDPARQIEELHLCGGAQTEYLRAIATDDKLDPWFRGHAAAALGRLAVHAGPGYPATDDHPASPSRDELVRALLVLASEARGVVPVLQGCLLGLGAVVDGDGDAADEAARMLLLECTRRDEPMAQRFALVSLAAALGRPGTGAEPDAAWKGGSALLLREFSRAKEAWLPWYALALAVTGHGRVDHRLPVPESHVDALRMRLSQVKQVDEAAALALALAVLRPADPAAAAALRKVFERQSDPFARTCTALALGLLGAREATGPLEAALDARDASIEEVIAASIGLRLLGDPDVVPDLVKRLAHTEAAESAQALALVHGLALLQDPAAGEPLLALAADEARTEDLRAALVWCLGVLADPDAPDWTATYANGLDFQFMPWTLRSPLGDGRGLLDWR